MRVPKFLLKVRQVSGQVPWPFWLVSPQLNSHLKWPHTHQGSWYPVSADIKCVCVCVREREREREGERERESERES